MEPTVYSYEEAKASCLEYFGGDELAASVVVDKYLLKNRNDDLLEKNPSDKHRRMAKEFARIEKNKFKEPLSEDEIFDLFDKYKRIIPQGSPMYGIGNPYQYVSISNCFVLPSELFDSYLSIMYTDTQITQLSCRRGGIGFDVSNLRPKNTPVSNAAKTTSGAIEFVKRFSNTVREIAQNGRRAASLQSMNVKHPEILDFIKCKRDLVSVTGSNITIQFTDDFMDAVINDKEFELKWPIDSDSPQVSNIVNAKDIWKEFIHSNWLMGDPGSAYINTIHRRSTSYPYKEFGFAETSSNPCITGDTLVYTADGRGNIPIKELSDIGNDLDVFCLDDNNKVCIRKMRHPRLTGKNVKVYKLMLDDGSIIKCTENHKFLLTNGEYKELKDLQPKDSLKIITRFEASIKDIFPKANSRSQDYYWVNNGQASNIAEHRIIAEHNYGQVPYQHVVHHIDYNAKNNSPDNLFIMSKVDHDELHSKDMIGDKNPMRRAKYEWSNEKWDNYRLNMSKATSGDKNGRYLNVTNEELLEHAKLLTIKLGRRFSKGEWYKYAKDNNLPQEFSKFRKDRFGGTVGLSKEAATILGYKNIDSDPRLVNTLNRMKSQGYNCSIVNNKVMVERTCESCNNKFFIEHLRRESCFCSQSCTTKYLQKNEFRTKASINRRKTEEKLRLEKRELQIKCYLNLKLKLDRNPKQDEWEVACKNDNIPYRVGKHSYFKTYTQLKEEACNYNHKVVSVEFEGYEDVYNGTVDEFHNFLIGGFESKTENNKNKWQYLCNRQCGEQYLPPGCSCRLMAINLSTYVENKFTDKSLFNFEKFTTDVKLMQRLADDMVDLEIEAINNIINKILSDPEPDYIKRIGLETWQTIKDKSLQDRRTGCGFTALADCLAFMNMKYDSNEALNFVEKMIKEFKYACYEESVNLAKELGPFPLYDKNLDINSEFIKELKEEYPDLVKKMEKYGRRNMTLMTVAPTGSVSCLTQTSSGLEPVFMLSYTRRKKGNPGDRNFKVDFTDKTGDNWMHFEVLHKGLQEWKNITGNENIKESPYFNCTAHDIDYMKKVEILSILSKHVDNSISNTLNLPNNIDEETMSKIYIKAYQLGCKGFTTYRDKCRDGVLFSKENKEVSSERPKSLQCDIHHHSVRGTPYFVLVGIKDGKPYEVFAGKNGMLPMKAKIGTITRLSRPKSYRLELDGETVLQPITASCSDDQEALTRLISTGLRFGTPIEILVDQLEKVAGDMTSFAKAISRSLKGYIQDGVKSDLNCPQCEQKSLVRQEGCVKCTNCTYSGCS